MKYYIKIILIFFSSGFLIYIMNTIFFPISEKLNNKSSEYWFQQAYFRNEIYLYTDKIKDNNLLYKLKNHSKNLENNNNINTIEYLNIYIDYISQLQQLSRMILELEEHIGFVLNDIEFLLVNLEEKYKNKELVKRIRLHIENITLVRNKIKNSNKDINNLKQTIKNEYDIYNVKNTSLINENNTTNKINNSIINEIPLLKIIGRIKYDKKYGLKNPDLFLKPIRNFGQDAILLKNDYEDLLILYNKQIEKQIVVNKIVNYFIYLFFILFLLNDVRINKNNINKSI